MVLLCRRFWIPYYLMWPSWTVAALKFQSGFRESESSCPELEGMPVYVLNLDRRRERLQRQIDVIESEAPWLMSHTCRIAAPDGSRMTRAHPRLVNKDAWLAAAERAQNHTRVSPHELTPGSIALIIGHGLIWEHIRQQNFSFGIVIEDDITHFHPFLERFLCKLAQKPIDWDYLQIQRGRKTFDMLPLRKVSDTGPNTGMYAITRETAARALEYHFPIRKLQQQLDSPEEFLRKKTRAFSVFPPGASQRSSKIETDTQLYRMMERSTRTTRTTMRNCSKLADKDMLLPALLSAADLRRRVRPPPRTHVGVH
mmetsp:Transcript_57490/g.168328  ORF Transcript_57490/g.168328 Transcript_57490/m.168328 type:complete len:312 (+) Transcript_57490:50-985(+)